MTTSAGARMLPPLATSPSQQAPPLMLRNYSQHARQMRWLGHPPIEPWRWQAVMSLMLSPD